MEKFKTIRIDVISLLLIPICSYFLGTIGLIISVPLLIIYYLSARNHYLTQKIIIFICSMGLLFAFSGLFLINGMENTGMDGIGEALIYGTMINTGSLATMICPIILLIIDNKNYIFSKKLVKIIIIVGIGLCLFFLCRNLITTTRISDDIPSVSNFEKELNKRGFSPDTSDYRLYGVNNKDNKAIRLFFDKDNKKQYPLYVYSVI